MSSLVTTIIVLKGRGWLYCVRLGRAPHGTYFGYLTSSRRRRDRVGAIHALPHHNAEQLITDAQAVYDYLLKRLAETPNPIATHVLQTH
jgi:hypothetical protein